jgi:hypothetical protein
VSNDPGVFDQSGAGALPDGERETICAPPAGAVRNLRLAKLDGGLTLRFAWDDAANADGYVVFADQDCGGAFNAQVGTASSGATGVTTAMPPTSEFFLVSGTNTSCGIGFKR